MKKTITLLFSVLILISSVNAQTQVNPKTYPYCFVVKLLTYEGGRQFHGTGVIINDSCVITNAHNVEGKDSIVILSGYNSIAGTETGKATAVCIYGKTTFYDRRFEDNKLHNYFDFAVIKFNGKQLFTQLLQVSQGQTFVFQQTTFNGNQRLNIAGYPYFRFFEIGKPKHAKVQYHNYTDNAELTNEGLINYKMNTRGGSSGSPLWIEQNGRLYIVGIHKSGAGKNNQGIYYNAERYALIQSWITL